MIVPYFLDTNILVYAALSQGGDERKVRIAAELIAAGPFGLSGQVLQEFYWTVTRKGSPPLEVAVAMEWLDMLSEQQVQPLDASLVRLGALMAERYRISYWDGAILAAAESLGAPVVYTEDLNHGQDYGTVRAINPFIENAPAGGFHEGQQSYAEN